MGAVGRHARDAHAANSEPLSGFSAVFDTMVGMETDELAEHLDALKREECYRVDAVLKETPHEITQRVYFMGANGSEQGPYIRKYIRRDSGMGSAYARISEAQRIGKRFLYLPRVIECYAAGDDFVVVMEHVLGETLAEVVYRCDPSLALATDVFPRLCDAVGELHEEFDPPLIHRDLKPGNVMLSRGSLTIIDFGIARAYREGSDADTVRFGTRAYAPPEQFGFRQTDARSDVYALGMLLYFCLVEKTPDAHVREQGFSDSRIPMSLREVLLRATAFDPDDRYGSARELKEAFLAAVSGASAFGEKAPLAVRPEREGAPAAEPSGIPAPRKPSGPHIPRWMGTVWNIAVACFLVCILAVGLSAAMHPNADRAAYPQAYAVSLDIYTGLLFVVLAYLALDKRFLRERFPFFARVRGKGEWLLCAAVALVGIAAVCVVYAATGAGGI